MRQPLAGWLGWYGWTVYAWGPMLFLLTLLALVGLLPARWSRKDEVPSRNHRDRRPLIFLLTATGVGLMAAPAVTAEFVWRYQLPFVVLIPAAAVLAALRLSRQPGTDATPSTDWPNGGVTRRSTNRVVGTTNRS